MAYLNLYILTFNCARNLIDTNLFASHLFDALPRSQPSGLPEVLVLSLQEIAPLSYSFLGGYFLDPYYDAFRRAVELAVSDRDKDMNYVNTVARNVGMTGIMVFVRQDVAGKVAGVETAEAGVGFQEMGNKGAVGARLKYLVREEERETVDLTFVAAHLAPMEDQVERRNRDWESIARRLVFSGDATSTPREDAIDREDVPLLEGENSFSHPTGMFTPTSHLFFAGDLNYRTSGTSPGEDGHKAFPQPTSDRNSKKHYTCLLKDDQLSKEIHANRTLHGLSEAPIDFPPTYKYSDGAHLIGSGNGATEWRWAPHRWPSWCDRILYLDAPSWVNDFGAVKPSVYDALPLFPSSDHRAVALSVSVPLKPIPAPGLLSEMNDVSDSDIRLSPPFDVDMDWKYKRSVARSKEIIVGILAYLCLTWQGNGLILASGFGVFGGWLVLRAYLVG